AKRVITEIIIEADQQDSFQDFGVLSPESSSAEAIKARLLESGCWPFIMQRPYAVIADTEQEPKAIFVSAYSTAPLANDADFSLKGIEKKLHAAVTALSKLTRGQVHVGVGNKGSTPIKCMKDISLHTVAGLPPAGNVGTHINKISDVNK